MTVRFEGSALGTVELRAALDDALVHARAALADGPALALAHERADAGTITIDGHDTPSAAGASLSDLVSAINSDASATVYAAATDAGTLVLSARREASRP